MDMDISVLEKMGISVVRTMDKRYKISTSQNSKFNLEEHLVKELISLVNRNYLIDTESLIKYLNIRLYYGSRIAALFLNNNTTSERLKKTPFCERPLRFSQEQKAKQKAATGSK